MQTRFRQSGLIVAALALMLPGCSSAMSSSSSGVAIASLDPSGAPSAAPALEPSASAAAPSASVATPTQPPAVVDAKWTKPVRIANSNGCGSASAGIDATGAYHIAASCSSHVRYSVSRGDGVWTTTDLAAPTAREEFDPKLAFEAGTMYLAYTRVDPQGTTCGTDPDVGVYVRRRTLPDGTWSSAVRLGLTGDALQSFREDAGSFYATVRGSDGHSHFETLAGSDFHRNVIPGLQTALRVGTDGVARIAYLMADSIRLGRFTASGLSSSAIPGSTPFDSLPVLILDAHDRAHVLWNRYPYFVGCGGDGPGSDVGTYYATNASGTWKSERITSAVGFASLQEDDLTGQVHILVASSAAVRYFTKVVNASWTTATLASWDTLESIESGAIARDPSRGTLLAVWVSAGPSPGIYFATKG